jgi:hypothetical protein
MENHSTIDSLWVPMTENQTSVPEALSKVP